jgi:hypothetical protein
MVGAALGDGYLAQGNQMLRSLQALVQSNVLGRLTIPPVSPSNGDTYIVGVGATGTWSGHDGAIAYWSTQNLSASAWDFFAPQEGWLTYNQSDAQLYYYNGAIWVPFGGVRLETSGQGFFCGAGMGYVGLFQNQNANAAITGTTADKVVVYQFVLEATWVLSSCSYKLSATSAATHFSFGLYNASGAKLVDCLFDGSISTLQTVSFAPVTLQPGTYYFACSATSATPTGPVFFSSGGTSIQELVMLNAVHPLLATAANSTSGNVMPATLGALTAITTAAFWTGMPVPVWAV